MAEPPTTSPGPGAAPERDVLVAPLADEVTLVLDDYHLIEAPPVHDSVTFLLDRLPPGLRLVLATRADPPLPLARLRARGQLAELRAADLRFTLDETAAFLREATGLDLPAASLAALQDRTEGWAAGVQLAALPLQGRPDPASFVATFTGSHRYVLDYLTEEVLARQPERVVGFLLETSVLERLSGPLCDAVTGRADGQALLEALERANLFVVPLDEVRGWWRYHHLFADLLRVRLAHERPERVADLHRVATAWHEEHGFADEAVRHALAAGEAAWAARLVERHVEPLLVDAERAFTVSGDEPHEPSVGRALSVLANVPAAIAFLRADLARLRGDAEGAVACDQQALEALALGGPGGYVRVFVDEGAPMARLLGRLATAQRTGRVAPPGAVPPDYLDRLARAFQPGGARAAPRTTGDAAGVAGLVEPLSDREVEVLGLLAAGRSATRRRSTACSARSATSAYR